MKSINVFEYFKSVYKKANDYEKSIIFFLLENIEACIESRSKLENAEPYEDEYEDPYEPSYEEQLSAFMRYQG